MIDQVQSQVYVVACKTLTFSYQLTQTFVTISILFCNSHRQTRGIVSVVLQGCRGENNAKTPLIKVTCVHISKSCFSWIKGTYTLHLSSPRQSLLLVMYTAVGECNYQVLTPHQIICNIYSPTQSTGNSYPLQQEHW